MGKKRASNRRPTGCPSHLSDGAATEWGRLQAEWGVSDAVGLLVLQTAMEAYDRMREAQGQITSLGMIIPDRFGQEKINPACTVERDSRAAMLSALRQAGIEVDES